MAAIVLIVEPQGICGNLVESFHHAAFVVKVREAQGTGDGCHPKFLSIADYGVNKGPGNLHVIYEVYPAETDLLMVPVAVCDVIYDCCNAAGHLTVLICQKKP